MSKVWLVTGCSRGIGRCLAEAVLDSGDRLAATALQHEMHRLADLKARHGDQVCVIPLDVRDQDAAERAVQATLDGFGGLDVVVNNAGYGDVGSIEDTSLDDLRAQIETNLFGAIHVTKAALPVLRERRSGHFIQFSSIAGRIGPPGRGAYSAAKWGIEGFSETLSKEVSPLGIKVTIIEPGGFRTDFAGASTTMRPSRTEYDSTVGEVIRFQQAYNGSQPGDPAKAAAVLLEIAKLEAPPLRLVLGEAAYAMVEANELARLEALRKWRHLSLATEFDRAPS